MKRILVVDGDTGVRARIAKHARMEGYDVTEAGDGETALSLSRQQNAFDLMVLAVNLPGMDGFTVLKAVRTFSAIPVLILSSKNTAEDRIHGLELGADDYMTKPFSLAVLRARVNRLLRRGSAPAAALELGPFSFDFERLRFMRNGTEVELSKTEQRLLRLLVEHRGQTLTREQLLDRVWDGGEFVDANALSVAVKRLRDKLTDAPIKTVYGLGYTWEEKR